MAPLIRLDGVAKRIPGSAALALRNATCTVAPGEFVCVIGTSGSGKTTLLSLLGLLDRPSAGTYRFDGVDVDGLSERARNRFRGHRIGFVFQNSYLVGEETAARNVGLGLRVRGVRVAQQRRLVAEALAAVGLTALADKPAGDLSGGEKQRVAVARALVGRPDVILADEPTGALDSESTARLISLLQQINRQGTTVVVVTHDPLVAAAAGRVIHLEDGVTSASEPAAGIVPGAPSTPPSGTRVGRVRQELADALRAPLSRPVRTLLVLLAYVLGIAALVGAMGVASSTTGQIVHRLTEAGSNQIRVVDTSPGSREWSYLDAQAGTLGRLEGVGAAVPVRTFTVVGNTVTRLRGVGGKYTGGLTMTDQRYMAAYGMTADNGAVNLLSNPWDGPVVVLGSVAATSLGVARAEPGVVIWVNDRPVDVAAVLAPSGDTLRDNTAYFSPGAATMLVDPLDSYVDVHTLPGYAEPLAKAIPVSLMPTNPGQIQCSTVAQLAQLQQGINSDLGTLLNTIGLVILVLSALTAGTTMFLSVQHRAAEIALRRATGASRGSVFRLFLVEGTAIGLAGGIFGSALGIGLAAVVAYLNGWPLALGLGVVGLGIGVGLVAGGVASIIPAVYAARRDPAAILRTV